MFIRGIQNSRNFHPSRSERLACFETQTSSEDFLEFSGTSCTLYFKKIAFSNRILCICKYFILDERFIHFRSWHFEIGLSALIWDLCWIIFAMCSADFNCVKGSTSQVCITLACVASVFVWFRSNERPRNGILGFGRARNETRANKWRGGGGGGGERFPCFLPHPLLALLLAPFLARSWTLVPRSLLPNRTETLATQAWARALLKPYSKRACNRRCSYGQKTVWGLIEVENFSLSGLSRGS